MEDTNRQNRIQIMIAIIGLIGVLGAALLTNFDSVIGALFPTKPPEVILPPNSVSNPEPIALTTSNWKGQWICTYTKTESIMLLEIFGSGRNSSLMADYLVENASENYKVANADDLWAEGTYVYNDSRGKWEGNWEITIKTEVLSLKRMDLSSGWEGTYICERN